MSKYFELSIGRKWVVKVKDDDDLPDVIQEYLGINMADFVEARELHPRASANDWQDNWLDFDTTQEERNVLSG